MKYNYAYLLFCFVSLMTVCQAQNAPWTARQDFAAVAYHDRLWVMGGTNNDLETQPHREDEKQFGDVWLTINGVDWTTATQVAPWGPRDSLSAVVFKDMIWVMGGITDKGTMNDVWNTTDGQHWECVTSNAPWTARYRTASIVFQDKLFLIGGCNEHGRGVDQVWFTSDGRNWNQASAPPWHSERKVAIAIHDNQLWLLCGVDYPMGVDYPKGAYHIALWQSSDGVNWQEILHNAPFRRA